MPTEPNPAPSDTDPEATTTAPFTALGYQKELCVFRLADGECHGFARDALREPPNLLLLAPSAWWAAHCQPAGSDFIDIDRAQALAVSLCDQAGPLAVMTTALRVHGASLHSGGAPDPETPEAAPDDFDRFLADLARLDAQYADISRRAEALGLGAVYRHASTHFTVQAPGDPKPDTLLGAIESLRAELRAVIALSVDIIAGELVSPPDLDRPRLRAALLQAVAGEFYRERMRAVRSCGGAMAQPTPVECQALAEALEAHWTLDGTLTPRAAIVLRNAAQATLNGFRPDSESLRELATWLGLLPAAAPPTDPTAEVA